MRKTILWFCLALIFVSFGCLSIALALDSLKVTKVGESSYPAKSKKEAVEVYLSGKPEKEYEVIAQISGSFTGEPKDVLEAKTRKAGGDAVIITDLSVKIESEKSQMGIQQGSRPVAGGISPTYTPGYSYKVYTVKGVIIKYKE
jgi:hypothetical protein